MNKRGWSARVVIKYALLQVPGVALLVVILIVVQRWVALPAWLSWGLVALWVAKDVILFPFVWRAYDSRDTNSMVGMRGTAVNRLAPSGYVRVRGELWRAEVMGDGPPIDEGEAVRVRGICGLTLFIEPDSEEIGNRGR